MTIEIVLKLTDPDILANEIVENIEASLESFREIANNLE